MLETFGEAIVATPLHARGLIGQIHRRIRIDLFGNLAHCVQRAPDPIQGLRLITHSETAAAGNPAKVNTRHCRRHRGHSIQSRRPPKRVAARNKRKLIGMPVATGRILPLRQQTMAPKSDGLPGEPCSWRAL
jgi:hypothetical protein